MSNQANEQIPGPAPDDPPQNGLPPNGPAPDDPPQNGLPPNGPAPDDPPQNGLPPNGPAPDDPPPNGLPPNGPAPNDENEEILSDCSIDDITLASMSDWSSHSESESEDEETITVAQYLRKKSSSPEPPKEPLEPFPGPFPTVVNERILRYLPFRPLNRFRVVCREWNQLVVNSILPKSAPTLSIKYYEYNDELEKDDNYGIYLRATKVLRKILRRHSGTNSLIIASNDITYDDPLELHISQAQSFSILPNLQQLDLHEFTLSPQFIACFQDLPRLHSICFSNCNFTGENLNLLPNSIRSLHFHSCQSLEKEHLIDAFRSFNARQIPFEDLNFWNIQGWNDSRQSHSIMKYCLENLACLKKLMVEYTNDLTGNLQRFAAYGLEDFKLKQDTISRNYNRFSGLYSKMFRTRMYLKNISILQINSFFLQKLLTVCCPNTLLTLKFYTDAPIDDFFIKLLRFKKLKRLEIHCKNIFEMKHLVKLVHVMPKLKRLIIEKVDVPTPKIMKSLAIKHRKFILNYQRRYKRTEIDITFDGTEHGYMLEMLRKYRYKHKLSAHPEGELKIYL